MRGYFCGEIDDDLRNFTTFAQILDCLIVVANRLIKKNTKNYEKNLYTSCVGNPSNRLLGNIAIDGKTH